MGDYSDKKNGGLNARRYETDREPSTKLLLQLATKTAKTKQSQAEEDRRGTTFRNAVSVERNMRNGPIEDGHGRNVVRPADDSLVVRNG